MAKPKGWVKEPARHGLAAKGIKTALKRERVPGTASKFRLIGMKGIVESEKEFRELVAALGEHRGLIYFDTPEGLFSIRFGDVVFIPYRGVYDYDPRFSNLDGFIEWIQKEGIPDVVVRWEPYPEDRRYYEDFVAHWFRE